MKRYDLSKLMKRAHGFLKTGKYTWSECLKKAWKMAKFDAKIAEEHSIIEAEAKAREEQEQERIEQAQIRSILFNAQLEADRIKREAESKAQRMRDEIAARKQGVSYEEYQTRLSYAMGYGRGLYCGD